MSGERDRTDPGVGTARGPSREPTVLGVGTTQAAAPPAPVVVLAPTRERTVLGVAPAAASPVLQALSREPSVREPPAEDWDVPAPAQAPVALEPAAASPREPSIAVDLSELDGGAKEPSLVPAGVPRRRARPWLLFLGLVAAAAAGGFVCREQLRPLAARVRPVFARVVAAIAPNHVTDPPR